MPSQGSAPTVTENAKVQLLVNGIWVTIPGAGSIRDRTGDAPTRENVTFGSVKQIVGKSRPPSVEISLPAVAPGHSTYGVLKTAFDKETNVRIRYGFAEEVLFERTTAGTIAIATDGSVTFSGTNAEHPDFREEDYGPGIAFRTGTGQNIVYDVIETIDDSSARDVECQPRTTALTAVAYDVVIPGFYRPSFLARVSQWDGVTADGESEVSMDLGLAARGSLPALKLGVI